MVQELSNFKVIVTGGTGDLGQTVIDEFIKKGASIFTNYRNPEKYATLEKTLNPGKKLQGCQADLTQESEVTSFFEEYNKSFKRLDIFIHIMGGFWMGPELAETGLDKWQHMFDINLNSAFLCGREAFKIMKSQCSGKIFTISAKSAQEFPAGMGAYVISKSAVLSLTRVLANEGKQYNIQANSILPSIIDTQANRKAMPGADYSEWVTPKAIAGLLIQLSKAEAQALSHSAIKVYGKL